MIDDKTLEQAVSDLLLLAPHVELAAHQPGRISFKLKLSALSVAKSLDPERMAKQIPGILKTDLKLFSGTVIIDYDPAQLAPEVWEELGRLSADPGQRAAVHARLAALLRASGPTAQA